MRNTLFLFLCLYISCFANPKPMESIENYNVLMVHGAYGSEKGIEENGNLKEADSTSSFLGGATLGSYTSDNRITKWLGSNIFEESDIGEERKPSNAYIYNWRSFTNPANSSHNNAYELGSRIWNGNNVRFGHRRSLMEEAQEVKTSEIVDDSGKVRKGQFALQFIRQHPDLYRQLASRYILVGHSMGGVVSREYVQGDFYNGDVDKIITLDSPHEGTGAMNMLVSKRLDDDFWKHTRDNIKSSIPGAIASAIPMLLVSNTSAVGNAVTSIAVNTIIQELGDLVVSGLIWLDLAPSYYYDDPLVHYVDPHQTGDQTIHSLNRLEYKSKVDSLPMFRILASQHGMTYTDPNDVDYGYAQSVNGLLIDNYKLPYLNYEAQIKGTGDYSARYINALTAHTLGYAGIPMMTTGSSIVPATSSAGVNVNVLNDVNVDTRRLYFNAAPNATGTLGDITTIFGSLVNEIIAVDYALEVIPGLSDVVKIAMGLSAGSVIGPSLIGALGVGIADIASSHQLPIDKGFKDWMLNDSVHIYEDFLYERPFVNLALSDSRTMDMLAQDSSLNPNCYFESDSLQKVPLCEVGLYGSRDSVVIDPVTMKETHIYNAAVAKTDSTGNAVLDSSGNVVYDSVYYGTFEQRKYSEFRNSPLKFKAESDWYKVGVKVDRWERVDGLKPNGDLAQKGVPIRHVERYSVPDIVATGFIEKYSFVVDDLMPHRMRQIKMTFNSNEEVAWECDITKPEEDQHACAVYKRKLGNSWGDPDTTIGDKGYVAHPIKKNGRFDFDARTYFGNLADIQKDNQNTVMISMVNKIGLSNTQRFYYLFKATDNMLKPKWPEHDVVLNAIDGFKAYVSALDYQGFRVHNASDAFFRDSLGNVVQTYSTQAMDTAIVIGNNNSEYVFVSNQNDSDPAEGSYRWVVSTNISNKELKDPSEPDSNKTDSYEVHFKVDRTAPAFTLTSDAMMNPDSSMFITRFKWDGSGLSDIRVMRWTLEKASNGSPNTFTKVAELPALYDVASNEFAIAWDKVPQDKRNAMDDGLYRIAAYAIDYAVPNESAYHAMNALVDGIFSNPMDTSVWTSVASFNLNDTTIYAEFRVDHTTPVFMYRGTGAVPLSQNEPVGVAVNLSGKYDVLRANRPARDADWTYISGDSLLKIDYVVKETLNGLDSAAVTIGWNFVHLPDTNVIDRAGDSVWVFKSLNDRTSGSWTEMAGLRMADGEYSVRAILRDEAKNVRHDIVPKRVRVDRTAPQIVGLTSDHLVYIDKDGDFSATILVSEKADIGVNRTGMHCSCRVLGGADSSWHEIRKGDRKLLANDTVKFSIAKSSVNTARGIRYLEAACVDAAGNVSVRTDIFHVGARFPQITYPQADSIQSDQNYIPIVGIAPKTSSADSLSSVYRLRYRVDNDTTWRTDKIKVVAANRSTSADNISRISQSTEGVLGYLENVNFGNEALVYVELAVASCEICNDWTAVTTNVVVIPPDTNYSKPTVEFAVTRNGSDVNMFKVDDGPVNISVRLKNKFNSNYMLRVYAEDSKHRGIFDAAVEKVFYNPYYGLPTVTAPDTGIWFHELDGKYHLKWKNLDKINLKVGYNSAKFGETCKGTNGNMDYGCLTEYAPVNIGSMLDAAKAYLADYPEWMPPAYIDSTMTISAASGEIVMEAEEAFRVYVERNDVLDTSVLNIPVYFGENSKPGFCWRAGVDTTVSPLVTGWTVNPNAYGLNYRWNGIATSGAYPSGEITLYAEVTENILDNPYVTVVEKKLRVEQKEIELVVPRSLPDYIALKVVDSDSVAYMRDSMKVYFGLRNGDARVEISIMNADTVVATILDRTLKAHTGDSAYFATWDGKNRHGDVQSEGAYYVKFVLYSDSTRTAELQSETVPFKLRLRNGMSDVTPEDPRDPSRQGFYVAEAKKVANDVYRYEPYADYLVVANMDGWYLPDSLRNRTYNVMGNVSGTQNILGFRPERFNLGIKRHRDTLEMYVVTRIHAQTVMLKDCAHLWWYSCTFDSIPKDTFFVFANKFTENSLSWSKDFGIVFPERGMYDFSRAYLDIVACSRKKWNEIGGNDKQMDSVLFSEAVQKCEWNMHNVYGKREYMGDPGKCTSVDDNFAPGTNLVGVYESNDNDDGCVAKVENGYLESICAYPKKNDSEKYDPNRKLFDVKLNPGSYGRFFNHCKQINDYNTNDYYWTTIDFGLNLTIPDSYWNAPFGMDNLVNRTIRFDHTNSTIFNEGNDDGYWNAVWGKGKNQGKAINPGLGNYFDGDKWNFNRRYGLLTPFEVQRLDFYPANQFPNGSNVFLFDDESVRYKYSSSFELKFFGQDTSTHHFEAKVVGNLADPLSVAGCETDASKFVESFNVASPCQVSLTSASNTSVRTPVFTHGNVHFYVGMNRLWSEADKDSGTVIPYPADYGTWRDAVKDSCPENKTWEDYRRFAAEGLQQYVCYKYYGSGSKVHFYFNDYGNNDSLWKSIFLTDSTQYSTRYIRNLVNSPDFYYRPQFVDSMMAINKAGLNGKDFLLSYSINPEDYIQGGGDTAPGKFFIRLDSLKKIKEGYAGAGVDIQRINVDSVALDCRASYDSSSMMLYVNAERWMDTVVYRRSNDSTKTVLERPGDTLPVRDVYVYRVDPDANGCEKALYCVDSLHPQSGLVLNPWIKDPVVASTTILQVDFTEHPVLGISDTRDLDDRRIVFKDTVVPRPPELVEVRGKLTPGQTYTLSFLNDSTYYTISDSLVVDSGCAKYPDGSCHLAWFDVNRLQGRTQFLLTWGGADGNPTNAMHFNMYIGSAIEPDKKGVVKSMYGELTVTFPEGSLDKAEDFTVRTVNVQKDYGFGVFKNMALTGPVMEVLPSMTFNDTNNLPRIRMRISRQEMEDMHVTPQTLRLYKVDFENRQFVPLEDVLYGFLHADGSAVLNTNGDTLTCSVKSEDNPRCTDEGLQWEYVLVSAQTRTFSVFVAMDSLAASMPRIGLDVLPAVAKSSEREVRIDGVDDFNLYVDDDSQWNDDGDLTPMVPLSFTLDMDGVAHVMLPTRSSEIDTNYVFAFAKVNGEEVLAPAVEMALTVPSQFACRVPSDLLWMGTDNGYLAYGASCNHPGNGMLSLYRGDTLVVEIRGEIPDTIRYDGKRLVGGSVVGNIPYGRYETRYVGFSDLGEDARLVGPAVRTDSTRPVIASFEVLSGEDVLDRVFTVHANVKDVESGVASVVVSSRLGNTPRVPLMLQPDSLGNVTGVIRLTRSELAKCGGCVLSLELRAEDYGHNHSEKVYESGILYQFPTELALWYPSREGTGNIAHEYVGTGHNLDLTLVTSPWLGDAGIYFSESTDRAVGVGRAELGSSGSYSFEARIRIGYADGAGWYRVLGFKGVDGLEMELRVHGRKLQLLEGSHAWSTENAVLPVEKEWAHVVVTVDSSEVNFYVNGEIVKTLAAEPQNRKLVGVFSAGADDGKSFVGNVADVRMYKKALSGGEVFALSLPVSDDKDAEPEIVEIVTVPMITVDGVDGFEPGFSCSVPGNRYFESGRAGARLTMDALVEKAGTYRVMMLVRSASLKSADVAVWPSPEVRRAGTLPVSPVWRTAMVSDVSLNLSAGMHTVTLEAPEGLQVAGFALVTANVPASSIAWNSSLENMERKVRTYVRYEGFDDKKMLQPRVRLTNISGSSIHGYSVRYYFRGEESSMARPHAYYPYDTTGLSLHSESARTGYVEWKFEDGVIPAGGTVFNGDGPHFGIHFEDWTPWNPYDDPSFVENAIDGFVQDDGVVVLDSDKRLIGGSCVEMEDSVSAEVKARVYATETRNDNQASEIQLKVENVGNVTLKNYDVRYYFFLEGGLAPQLESYVLPDGVSATLENIGEGRWLLSLRGSKPLVSGGAWKDNAQIVLHCENWNDVWNASDDPGRVGLGRDMVEAVGVNVFDSLGIRIYGNEPEWPEIAHVVMADSSLVPDYGLEQNDDRIPIHRTEDGLVVEIPQYTNISLSLVNAVGAPIRSLYSGTLAPGEQFVAVDWGGVDLNRTYLLLRVNGTIKSTKLLSLL